MYLEGDKWKNWHTRCSDAAIKENKSEEDTKLSTISVSKLLEYAHTALHHCEINNLDPIKFQYFLHQIIMRTCILMQDYLYVVVVSQALM